MRAVSPVIRGLIESQRLCLLALLLLAACGRWPPPEPPRETNLGLTISTSTLPSGLRVIVVTDPKATEVQVTTRYRVGAADDRDKPGMAHLVEHLLFEPIVDGQSIFAHLEEVATQFNATTTFDATTFVTRAPPSALGRLLALETHRLEARCGDLTDAAFAREREVVLNELANKHQATQLLAAVHTALYPEGHPYRRPVGGTIESIGAITREEACAFADAHYVPSNAVVVISGDLAPSNIDQALEPLRTQLTRREGAPRLPAPVAKIRPEHLDVTVPIDQSVLVLAWPLPTQPELAATVRAIGTSLVSSIDAEIRGQVVALELGDARAPMWAVAVLPDPSETMQQVIDGTRRGIAKLPDVFHEPQPENIDQVLFDRLKHGAIYRYYAALEDGSDRDTRLAMHLLGGRDPNQVLTSELAALRALTREQGAELAARYLASTSPTVLTLLPAPVPKRGEKLTLRAPVHDLGRRRTPPDPARAHRPAEREAPPAPVGLRERKLPNGLRVVLLPRTTVPTFDARLVFRAGTADEPPALRGVASVAAHALTWDLRYRDDLFAFASAGGVTSTDLDTDRTTFSVQGIDTQLDVVLAGLRRWVREGTYDDSALDFMAALRRAAKQVDDQGPLTDAWRAALFGADHPYVRAGISRHASRRLSIAAAAEFRNAHYTPDNATLVITGRFDPALAERWIDFLFADWEGTAATRGPRPAAAPQPASIASVDDVSMVQVRMAMPTGAPAGRDRARQLVAAAMLNDIANDVRHQLGASYAFDGQLAETRAGSFYALIGAVDASRSVEAVQLVRDRIHALQTDAAAAALAFVTARDQVLTRLRSHAGTVSALSARLEADVELGRRPLSAHTVADTVGELTLADMRPTLAGLDLARATVLIHGPAAEVKAAFDVLGRTPRYVEKPAAAPAPATEERPRPLGLHAQRVWRSELARSLTARPPSPRHVVMLMADMRWAEDLWSDAFEPPTWRGPYVAARFGLRFDWHQAIGLHLGVGKLSSTASQHAPTGQLTELVPVELLAFLHYDNDRVWGNLLGGMRFERTTGLTMQWRDTPMLGATVGIDLVRSGPGRLGVSASGTLSSEYGALTLGVAFRQ